MRHLLHIIALCVAPLILTSAFLLPRRSQLTRMDVSNSFITPIGRCNTEINAISTLEFRPHEKDGGNLTHTDGDLSIRTGLTNLLRGKGWDGKLAFSKEAMAKFGINCLLSYGFVSNFSYISCVIIAWIAHGKRYHVSPLAPGQWKQFLLIYSGLWVANNILRPLRFSISLLLSPFFDRGIQRIESVLNISRSKATALMVFLINFCGTISYLVFGLMVATRLANVPLLP